MKTTDSQFTFPEPIKSTPIQNLLDTTTGKGVEAESGSVANNIEKAKQMMRNQGPDPQKKKSCGL